MAKWLSRRAVSSSNCSPASLTGIYDPNGMGAMFFAVLAVAGQIVDTTWCIGVVLAADRAGAWLRRTGIRRRIERTLSAILVGLGLGLGLAADAR
ncbi:hypothetical protein ACIRRA_45465 [Nocardia sp. NPDC101769]|uniref:hypothetical protein n=1 Tax=Nocardia sp. NPDC101769 TaxID=3364333 RepID=UPI0038084859